MLGNWPIRGLLVWLDSRIAMWALYRYAAHQEKIPHELRGYLEMHYENWDRIEAALYVVTTSPEGFKTLTPMQALARSRQLPTATPAWPSTRQDL